MVQHLTLSKSIFSCTLITYCFLLPMSGSFTMAAEDEPGIYNTDFPKSFNIPYFNKEAEKGIKNLLLAGDSKLSRFTLRVNKLDYFATNNEMLEYTDYKNQGLVISLSKENESITPTAVYEKEQEKFYYIINDQDVTYKTDNHLSTKKISSKQTEQEEGKHSTTTMSAHIDLGSKFGRAGTDFEKEKGKKETSACKDSEATEKSQTQAHPLKVGPHLQYAQKNVTRITAKQCVYDLVYNVSGKIAASYQIWHSKRGVVAFPVQEVFSNSKNANYLINKNGITIRYPKKIVPIKDENNETLLRTRSLSSPRNFLFDDSQTMIQNYDIQGTAAYSSSNIKDAERLFKNSILFSIGYNILEYSKESQSNLCQPAKSSLIKLIDLYLNNKEPHKALIWGFINQVHKNVSTSNNSNNNKKSSSHAGLESNSTSYQKGYDVFKDFSTIGSYLTNPIIDLRWERIRSQLEEADIKLSSSAIESLKIKTTQLSILASILKNKSHQYDALLLTGNAISSDGNRRQKNLVNFIGELNIPYLDLSSNNIDKNGLKEIVKSFNDKKQSINFIDLNDNSLTNIKDEFQLLKNLLEDKKSKNSLIGLSITNTDWWCNSDYTETNNPMKKIIYNKIISIMELVEKY